MVNIGERLRRLDEAVVPGVRRDRYDARRPWWFLYSGAMSAALCTAFIAGLSFHSGPWDVLGALPLLIAVAILWIANWRWARWHRVDS
jgi:hypothetical protein